MAQNGYSRFLKVKQQLFWPQAAYKVLCGYSQTKIRQVSQVPVPEHMPVPYSPLLKQAQALAQAPVPTVYLHRPVPYSLPLKQELGQASALAQAPVEVPVQQVLYIQAQHIRAPEAQPSALCIQALHG